MKLQLLIPQYTEDEDIVAPLLDSLAIQQNIDFDEVGAIIVNDGSDVHLPDEFFEYYPFKIEYILNLHKGVSETRNEALRHATADYVMFCDADDMFLSVISVWTILNDLQHAEYPDAMITPFLEEGRHPVTKEIFFFQHGLDTTFVHGKVYRREYLMEKHIFFNPNLTIHEDSYFNILAQDLTEKKIMSTAAVYLWKWRDESICRRDPKYILKTTTNLIDSIDALIDELTIRDFKAPIKQHVCSEVYDMYYQLNKPEWILPENECYRQKTIERFVKFFKKYHKEWDETPVMDRVALSQAIRERHIREGMLMERQTLNEWLEEIESMM